MTLSWGGIAASLLLGALVLSIALYGLALSGHFPREHRAEALRGHGGAATIAVTAVLAAAALIACGYAAYRQAPWYLVILFAGSALLMAPLVLARFPDSFVNGKTALNVLENVRREWPHLQWWRVVRDDGTLCFAEQADALTKQGIVIADDKKSVLVDERVVMEFGGDAMAPASKPVPMN